MLNIIGRIFIISILAVFMITACKSHNDGPSNSFTVKSKSPIGENIDVYEVIELVMNESINAGSIHNLEADVVGNINSNIFPVVKVVAGKEDTPDYENLNNEESIGAATLGQLIRKELFLLAPAIAGSTELNESSQATYFTNYSSNQEGDFIEVKADQLDVSGNTIKKAVLLYKVSSDSKVGRQNTLTVISDIDSESLKGSYSVKANKLTFTPEEPMAWDTSYRVEVKSSLKSSESSYSLLEDEGVWNFTTGTLPKAEITFVSHTGSIASPIKPIIVSFNFEPDSLTDWEGTLQIWQEQLDGEEPQLLKGDYSVEGKKVTFKPLKGYLDYNSSYSLQIKNDIFGINGREENYVVFSPFDDNGKAYQVDFSTPGPMLTDYSPTGISVQPSPVGGTLERKVEVEMAFNFNVKKNTVNYDNVYLKRTDKNKKVSVEFKTSGNTITLTTNSELDYGATYEVIVTSGVKALEGNVSLANSVSWEFSTQARKILQMYPKKSVDFMPGEKAFIETNFDIDLSKSYLQISGAETIKHSNATINSSSSGSKKRRIEINANLTKGIVYDTSFLLDYFLKASSGEAYSTSGKIFITVAVADIKITSRTPYPGSTDVDSDSLIKIKFSDKIDINGISSDASNLFDVIDCFNDYVDGNIKLDYSGQEITFYPEDLLEPFCKYTVILKEGIPLTDNGKTSTSSSWSFTTGGLEVSSVSADYQDSYYDIVYSDSNFVVKFDQNIYVIDSYGVYLEEIDGAYGGLTIHDVYVDGFARNLTVTPVYDLNPGSTYRLVIEQGSVEAYNGGGLLIGDWVYEFEVYDDSLYSQTNLTSKNKKSSALKSIVTIKTMEQFRQIESQTKTNKVSSKKGKDRRNRLKKQVN